MCIIDNKTRYMYNRNFKYLLSSMQIYTLFVIFFLYTDKVTPFQVFNKY